MEALVDLKQPVPLPDDGGWAVEILCRSCLQHLDYHRFIAAIRSFAKCADSTALSVLELYSSEALDLIVQTAPTRCRCKTPGPESPMAG